MMKRGILLDVDGTLWDAADVIRKSWNRYRQMSIPEIPEPFTDQQIRGVLGKTMTEIGDLLLAPVPPERRDKVMDGLMEYEVDYLRAHGGKVYPGVPETMKRLNEMGFHLYIVSNCQKGYIEDFMYASKTEGLVEDHVCFGDTGKPKDVSMQICIRRNSLDEALYVGDTGGDLAAARKAGIPFVYASYGFGLIDAERENVPEIRTFRELPETVRRIWKV